MIQSIAVGIVAGYGVLALVGGVMGYVKAKSRASLIAGGISGLVLIGSAVLATTQPVAGFVLACVVSVALVARGQGVRPHVRFSHHHEPSPGRRGAEVAVRGAVDGVGREVREGRRAYYLRYRRLS